MALGFPAHAAIKVAGQVLIELHYTRGVQTATGIVGTETSVTNWVNNSKDLNYLTIPARDAWVHLAATYDGSTETIYTNGSHAVNLNINSTGATYYPMLFSGILGPAPTGSRFSFNGGIAAVRVHTGALTASAVMVTRAKPGISRGVFENTSG